LLRFRWSHGLSYDETLARLLALKMERAAGQEEVPVVAVNDEEKSDEE